MESGQRLLLAVFALVESWWTAEMSGALLHCHQTAKLGRVSRIFSAIQRYGAGITTTEKGMCH